MIPKIGFENTYKYLVYVKSRVLRVDMRLLRTSHLAFDQMRWNGMGREKYSYRYITVYGEIRDYTSIMIGEMSGAVALKKDKNFAVSTYHVVLLVYT